jgi:SAM-dependent methyltransferase
VAAGGRVVGVDASEAQVAAARERGLDARVMDGEALAFDAEFDAVFSNAALHWMKRPRRVLDGVRRALRPGGRFVGEFGAKDNVAAIARALEDALGRRGLSHAERHPWYYPSGDEYRAELQAAGFLVSHLETFARPTPLPGDMNAWLETFAGAFLAAVPPGERGALCREVSDALAPSLLREGRWFAEYVRLRFAAVKPRGDGA